MLAGGTIKGIEAAGQKRKAAMEDARRRRLEQQYKQLQNSRQAVIDQSDEVRALKDQIYNPYANIGVAMQATNMQLEQSDEDLANILQSVNQAGAGGGAATQLARMASISKAQASASLEQQELQNQQLRIQGEAQVMNQKLNLEQMALQEEVAAWSRQEVRDTNDLGRIERLEGMANQRALIHEQQRYQAIQSMASDISSAGSSILQMGVKGAMKGGGGGKDSPTPSPSRSPLQSDGFGLGSSNSPFFSTSNWGDQSNYLTTPDMNLKLGDFWTK